MDEIKNLVKKADSHLNRAFLDIEALQNTRYATEEMRDKAADAASAIRIAIEYVARLRG